MITVILVREFHRCSLSCVHLKSLGISKLAVQWYCSTHSSCLMTVSFCPQRRQCCTEFYSCWPINISHEWSTVFRLSCCVYMLLGMSLLSWWTSVEGRSSDGLLPMSNRQHCCLRLVLFLCFVISVKAVMLSSAFLFCPFSRTKIIQIVMDGHLWNFEKVWEEFVRLCSWCLLVPVCFVDVRQMACTQRFEPSECFLTAIV